MLSPDELRRISQEAQQRLKQERSRAKQAEEEERVRCLLEKQEQDNAMADTAIAQIPEKVKKAASQGYRFLDVVAMKHGEWLDPDINNFRGWLDSREDDPRPQLKRQIDRTYGLFGSKQRRDELERELHEWETAQRVKFTVEGLRPHYRKIYDWCVCAKFRVEVVKGSDGWSGVIRIEW